MSRCSQTDALLASAFVGSDLSRGQAEHAGRCDHCARALAEARRFEAELQRAGIALAPEQLPSTVLGVTDRGGEAMRRGWNVAAVLVGAIAVVALVFGAGRWIAAEPLGTGFGPLFGDDERAARDAAEHRQREEAARRAVEQRSLDGEFHTWFEGALARTFEAASPDEVEIVAVDRCGGLYTVTFIEQREPGEFKWLVGRETDPAGSATGGVADAMDGSENAAARGSVNVECARIMDAAPRGPILDAVMAGAGVPNDATLSGSTLASPGVAIAVVEGKASLIDEEQRWFGLVRRDGARWSATSAEWVGTNIPANDGLTAYPLDMLDPGLDGDVIVGSVPAAVHEVELIVKGVVYRYAVDPGSAFVVVAPDDFDGSAAFRMRSSDPSTVAEGSIER